MGEGELSLKTILSIGLKPSLRFFFFFPGACLQHSYTCMQQLLLKAIASYVNTEHYYDDA